MGPSVRRRRAPAGGAPAGQFPCGLEQHDSPGGRILAAMQTGLLRIGTAVLLLAILNGCRPQDSQAAEREVGEAIEAITEAGEAAGAAVQRSAEDFADRAGTAGDADGASDGTVTPDGGTDDAAGRQAAVEQARTELAALRSRAEAREEAAEVADGVDRVRRELAAAYTSAEKEAADWWRETEPELEELEREARGQTADALESFSSTLERLERDARY